MSGVQNKSIQGMVSGEWIAPGMSPAEVTEIVKPMEDYISNAGWDDPVYLQGVPDKQDDFSAWWSKTEPQGGGYSGRLGSRLLDEKALTSDMSKLKETLKTTTPVPWNLLGHLVAGPGTHNPPDGIAGGSNAVGPGWREAYTHVGK